jgi:hypothetical protein
MITYDALSFDKSVQNHWMFNMQKTRRERRVMLGGRESERRRSGN